MADLVTLTIENTDNSAMVFSSAMIEHLDAAKRSLKGRPRSSISLQQRTSLIVHKHSLASMMVKKFVRNCFALKCVKVGERCRKETTKYFSIFLIESLLEL